MKFSFWLPAGLPWNDLSAAARHAADTGWYGLWLEDHFMDNTAEPNDGRRGECLTQLTALAATIPGVRIGSLVLGNTYRHPAVVAKQAAALSDIADGRFVLGYGAGWQENEHRSFGLEYGDVPSRIRWFREALEIVTRLRDEEFVDFAGEHYTLEHASLNPKPHAKLPLLVGGSGEKVMPKIVARFADEWNHWALPDGFARKKAIFDAALEKAGRAEDSLWRSTQSIVVFDDEKDAKERASKGHAVIGGSNQQLVDTMNAYAAAGADEFIVPVTHLTDPSEMADFADRFRTEVAAHVR